MSITIISLSSNMKEFERDIMNAREIKETISLDNCTDYRFFSNSEILIYNDRKIEYSCSYSEYKDQTFITDIYNRAGLVYKYDIDYREG